MELCGVNALSFAAGAYLPLSTTLPIYAGGVVKGIVDWRAKRKHKKAEGDDELGKGNLFATGLVAGGALAGVVVALLSVDEGIFAALEKINMHHNIANVIGENGYQLLGTVFFIAMAIVLYRIAIKPEKKDIE